MFSTSVASFRPSDKTIVNVAVAGDRIDQQLTRWQASASRGDATVKWIYVKCGVNDILQGASQATIRTRMASLITDIQTNNPNAAICLEKINPCRTYLDAHNVAFYAIWQGVNSDLATDYPTLYQHAISDALNDGADSLLPADDSGDNLHPNTPGNNVSGFTLNTWARALPGGWS